MKIIAFYLPQYYTFPENDNWWGKDFTEWTNVKKAQALFKDHYQPRVPYNNNYYSLSDTKVFYKQIELAKKYNIYGFCFYHYWFDTNVQLMEKPVEAYLADKNLDFPFCLCWANHSWTRTWVGDETEILMEQKYGRKKAIEEHFNYLLPFFKDDRYIKIDGKPIFCIYIPQRIPDLNERIAYYDKLAKINGFTGLCFISEEPECAYNPNKYSSMDYCITYEPNYSYGWFKHINSINGRVTEAIKNPRYIFNMTSQAVKRRLSGKFKSSKKLHLTIYSFDVFWKSILRRKIISRKLIASAFCSWDNTPRRAENGTLYKGSTPEKFEKYFNSLVSKVENEFEQQIIFFNAWNEWGEGAYLEPDEKYGDAYLQSIKRVLDTHSKIN